MAPACPIRRTYTKCRQLPSVHDAQNVAAARCFVSGFKKSVAREREGLESLSGEGELQLATCGVIAVVDSTSDPKASSAAMFSWARSNGQRFGIDSISP